MKRLISLLLSTLMLLSFTIPIQAASTEKDIAVAYLTEHGIYQGDASGDLHLDSGLTRAELAAILTRIRGDEATVLAGRAEYALNCHFPDVPEWAKPYVGYCSENLLMNGYSITRFGPSDSVNPQAACTVMLRHLGYLETDWNYNTATTKAVAVGLAPAEMVSGSTITRGDFAVIIYRAMTGETTPQENKTEPALTEKILDGTSWAREDFSQQANPAAFNEIYTRDAYNAIRQTIVDAELIMAGNNEKGFNPGYAYAHAVVSPETHKAVHQVVASASGKTLLSRTAETYVKNLYEYPTYFIVKATVRTATAVADEATEQYIASASNMTDFEKVEYFNDIVCNLMEYDVDSSSGINTVFSSKTPAQGACTSYANAFKYLCNQADIPCITISSPTHTWNILYVDGSWLHVDVSLNDLSHRKALLLAESYWEVDSTPEQTLFICELLVPGSTK